MNLVRFIPSLITLANLACGFACIIFALHGHYRLAGAFILLAAVFDFLDGFAARLLKAQSEFGKQLDSLADMVSFGLGPAMIAMGMMQTLVAFLARVNPAKHEFFIDCWPLHYTPVLIAVFSAVRLAKFNIDERQSDSFRGLPTPANALCWAGFSFLAFLDFDINNPMHLLWDGVSRYLGHPYGFTLLILASSLILVLPIPLFALKFKSFGWKGNEIRWVFLLLSLCIIALCLLTKIWALSLPLIILLYLISSIVVNVTRKKNELQS